MEIKAFYKNYIEPFVAIGILLMLVSTVVLLSREQGLKEEISQNCGWEGEGYTCYCEKDTVLKIQNLLDGDLEIPNVTFVK